MKALKAELNQALDAVSSLEYTVHSLQDEKVRYAYAVIFDKMKDRRTSLERVRVSTHYRQALERAESQTRLDLNETDAASSVENDRRGLQRVRFLVRYTGTVHLTCSMFSAHLPVVGCVSVKDRLGDFTGYLYLHPRGRSSTLRKCLQSVDGINRFKIIDLTPCCLREMPRYWDIVLGMEQNKENVKFDTTLQIFSEAFPEFTGFM